MLGDTSFLLPKVTHITLDSMCNDRQTMLKKLGYNSFLNETKNQISKLKYSRWTRFRKLTNDYEFPYDSRKIKRPISRAYFKLMEMIVDYNIDLNCNTLHLAEAPGGFIESTIYFKNKYKFINNRHYTFSILKQDEDTPTYHKKITDDSSVFILSNKINKGDLYEIPNMKYLIKTLLPKKIKFITCDGGFTENCDFAAKEELHHKLIFHEIITSLFILHDDGVLIVKIFDIFTELTFDFIYILSFLFGETYICKPLTSRPTNSEKYIVCKKYDKSKFDINIQNFIKHMCSSDVNKYSSFVYKNDIKQGFTDSVKNINEILMTQQISTIKAILAIEACDMKTSRSGENIKKWVAKYY